MESGLRLPIEKLDAKLKRYQRDNEYLRDRNKNLEVIIEIHKIEKKHFQLERSYRKLIFPNWRIKKREWFQSEIEKSRYKERNKQLWSGNNTLKQNH